MIFTLHRYIFKDLLKLFGLTTLVLSLVLSLGAMLRPLRTFNIDPLRVPELLLYTLPITLTMVIPIGALLATTLIYGRLAFFNEISACRSSGISMRTLLYPAITLALLVGMITMLLGFHVIPNFIARSELLVENDAEAIIYRNIEKRGNLGNLYRGLMVHADHTDPEKHLLSGVAFIRKDGNEIKEIATAKHVFLDLETTDSQETRIALRLIDARGIRDGQMVNIAEWTTYIPLPRLWNDEIKFKKLDELKQIRQDLVHFNPIAELLTRYRHQYAAERFFAWSDQQLRQNGKLELTAGAGDSISRIILKADGCRLKAANEEVSKNGSSRANVATFVNPANDSFRLAWYQPAEDKPSRYYKAARAELRLDWTGGKPVCLLKMDQVEKTFKNDSRPVREDSDVIYQIVIPETFLAQAAAVNLESLTQTASPPAGDETLSGYLVKFKQLIQKECRDLMVEIRAELYSRLAFGACCVVLTMMGAGLGIVYRSNHLLTAFGISFIPAALCLITIFTGKHLAEQHVDKPWVGLSFMWLGITLVAVIDGLLYRKLTRM